MVQAYTDPSVGNDEPSVVVGGLVFSGRICGQFSRWFGWRFRGLFCGLFLARALEIFKNDGDCVVFVFFDGFEQRFDTAHPARKAIRRISEFDNCFLQFIDFVAGFGCCIERPGDWDEQ